MVATQAKRMTEAEYREFALGDTNGQWELYGGELQEKPAMSARHGDVIDTLTRILHQQLDPREFRLRTQHARLRRTSDTYYVPDIVVIPTARGQALLDLTEETLDAYPEPLPLIVEVWSPSTGRYDISAKLPGYQQRGDLEIWYVHPIERTLTAWRRLQDGTYSQTLFRDGTIRADSLPNVAFALQELFAL